MGLYVFFADVLPQDFFLPSEAFDLIFLKAKIAILCTKGFEIMDLTEYVPYLISLGVLLKPFSSLSFKSVSIPQKDDPRLASFSKRLESCKPLGMFRCSENEFLLCYDGELSHLVHNGPLMCRHRIRHVCRPSW